MMKDKYGPAGLVLGGSEGIGAAFSELLARNGLNIILTGRDGQKAEKAAERIRREYNVKAEGFSCDMAGAGSMEKLLAVTDSCDIGIVVYNAAVAPIDPFLRIKQEVLDDLITVNCLRLQQIVRVFGEKLKNRGKGGIILLSSMASLQGSTYISSYAASKAFIRVLAEGLWLEYKKYNIDILACCPGMTSSPNYLNSEFGRKGMIFPPVLAPDKIASLTLPALGKKPVIIPGFWNALSGYFITHFVSRKQAVKIVSRQADTSYRSVHGNGI